MLWRLVRAAPTLALLLGAPTALADDLLARADERFADGELAEAAALYAAVLADSSLPAPRALGRAAALALWSNRLADARALLDRLHAVAPDEPDALHLAAELAYRGGDWSEAARLARLVGDEPRAAQLGRLAERGGAYRLARGPGETTLPFERTDPLPVVSLQVNGATGRFLVDTGGGELILDPEFATAAGAERFGSATGTFAAGRRSDFERGRVDSVGLGEQTLTEVPVVLLPTAAFAAAAGGRPVAGVLGMALLGRFLFTLDYPGARLVLRRPGGEADAAIAAEVRRPGAIVVPFWLAGDHFVVARGQLNDAPPALLLVDTGLAGAGFTGPDSALVAAGIAPAGESATGPGGGGTVTVTPIVVSRLALGAAVEVDVPGVAGAFPPELEHRFGFRLGGLVSHAFLRPYALTFDAVGMRLILVRG